MNGAVHALTAARDAGIEVCFANPGTTEMEFVSGLDEVRSIRSVLCLFEGVATGAADGYGRIAEKPALTLLHLGPGFANGIANLHNARRARSPVVNVIGDHASWHLPADAPLTSDIEALASPVSQFVRRVRGVDFIAEDMVAAIAGAMGPPPGVATLIVPQDAAWEAPGTSTEPRSPISEEPEISAGAIERTATLLREEPDRTGLLVGGSLGPASLEAAAAIRAATNCRVWCDTFSTRIAQGGGLPSFDAVPYFPEQAVEAFAGLSTLAIAGTRPPVAFFGYPGGQSDLLPDTCARIPLSGLQADPGPSLAALAAALDAPPMKPRSSASIPDVPDGPLDVMTLGAVIAAHQPEGAIVVNESATSGMGWAAHAPNAPRHDVLNLTGGAIGQGLPNALGAALAAPDRRVLAIQADGSGMYTLQSLWTMARENLDVTVIVCANRAYRILQFELARAGNVEPGPAARALTDLSHPELDWVHLARGMAVPACRANTTSELSSLLRHRFEESGPLLVEAVVS
ncbi:MAG: acetolactate synthase large subunit [Candidatus Binatia bacterium]|nr:acetolactate synthase large subunit [Candidatus Binatia bacterium]